MYEKLKKKLAEEGITKYRLAKMTNITPQDIYSLLHGKKPLYPNWRKRIAEALNMAEADLFEED